LNRECPRFARKGGGITRLSERKRRHRGAFCDLRNGKRKGPDKGSALGVERGSARKKRVREGSWSIFSRGVKKKAVVASGQEGWTNQGATGS